MTEYLPRGAPFDAEDAMIIWRGWGILVLLIAIFWLVVALVTASAAGYQDPDPIKSAAILYRICAVGLALSAGTIWLLARRRDRTAPGVDHLAFIPTRYWTYIAALGALGLFVASFVPAALQAAAA
jgi:hypothetical protein